MKLKFVGLTGICLILFASTCLGQQASVDSLRAALKTSVDANQAAFINLQLFSYLSNSKKDSALIHFNNAIKYREQMTDSVRGYMHVYYMQLMLGANKYDSVNFHFNEAMQSKENLNSSLLSNAYINNGLAHYFKGEYSKAIESYIEAEKAINMDDKLSTLKPRILNNIGIVYIQMENWPMAQRYMEKSLAQCKEQNIVRGISYTLGNLGIIYKNLGEVNNAIDAYEEAGEIFSGLSDTSALARNHQNIASLYEDQGDLETALKENMLGLKFSKAIGNKQITASILHNIGNIYSKQGNYNQSIIHLDEALSISKEISNKQTESEIYRAYADTNERNGRYKSALAYFEKFHILNDSLIGEEHLNTVSELEVKYETEKKENNILRLSEQQLKSGATIADQERQLRLLTTGLAVIIIITILSFFLYKQWLRNNKQNELLLAISETQTAERKRIAQDLHDGIGGSLALTKNKLASFAESLGSRTKEMDEAIDSISKTSEEVRQISHNLMPGELVRFGLVPAIHTLLEKLNKEELNAQLYTGQMEKRLESKTEIQLYRIIQEAIQNVLKHAQANNLYIHINKHKQFLSILIEDDGNGFIPKAKEGLGLQNIEQRVKILKGKFSFDTSDRKGTTLNIQIPI